MPLRTLIKTLSVAEYIKLNIQNTKTLRTDEYILYILESIVHSEEFLNLFKCLSSSVIHMITRRSYLLFKALHHSRKR